MTEERMKAIRDRYLRIGQRAVTVEMMLADVLDLLTEVERLRALPTLPVEAPL